MESVIKVLLIVFAVTVAVATFGALVDLVTGTKPDGSGFSLLEDLDEISKILAFGTLLELVGFTLVEGYLALRRRTVGVTART